MASYFGGVSVAAPAADQPWTVCTCEASMMIVPAVHAFNGDTGAATVELWLVRKGTAIDVAARFKVAHRSVTANATERFGPFTLGQGDSLCARSSSGLVNIVTAAQEVV